MIAGVLTNSEELQHKINATVSGLRGGGKSVFSSKRPPPPATIVADPEIYNGTVVLIFQDKVLPGGLHDILQQLRSIRPDNRETCPIYHVIALNSDRTSTVWLSPMGAVNVDDHSHVRDAITPYAEMMQEAALPQAMRARAASVSVCQVPPGLSATPSRRSRRPSRGRMSFSGGFSAPSEASTEPGGFRGMLRRLSR